MKDLINAYIDYNNDCLQLVERNEEEVSLRTASLSYACFIQQGELSREFEQQLRKIQEVKSLEIDGKYLRLDWKDRESLRKFCFESPNLGINTFDGDISPIRRYLTDSGRRISIPRGVYLDIETDSRVPFSKKEEMRILCWTLVDRASGKEIRGILEEDSDKAERALLIQLFTELNNYDQIISWNGDRFDFPVIKERTKKRKIRIETRRWLWLDHLELFRRMNMMGAESGEEKVSFALESIAQAVLGYGKSQYDSSKTWEGWLEDRQKLADYCAVDTQLMREIELKTGYIDLFHTLCEVCSVFPDSYGINPSVQVEGFLLAIAKERGYRFKTRLERFKVPSDQYKGAFVMAPTKSGMIKNVHVCDFTSLYPSIIITWNISPETKRATKDSHCSETPLTGQFYDTREVGILPYAVMELIRMRKEWQAKEKSLSPNTPDWFEAHRKSTAYKITANSFYGVVGSPLSRFFEREVAESVTQCGVWLIKNVIQAAESHGMKILMGDTDSAFVYDTTKEEFSNFVFDYCNGKLIPNLISETGCKECRIKLDYDKAFERLFIPADEDGIPVSKKYSGRILHSKGKQSTDESEPEVKGLEYKRGDSMRLARILQKEIINLLCKNKCEDPIVLAAVCEGYKKKVLTEQLNIDDISISKRLSKSLNEYSSKSKLDGTPAAQPPHVEIAKILGSRGRDVGEGSKISFVVIDGDSSPKKFIPAEDYKGDCDRFELWDNFIWPPVRRLLVPAFPGYDWTKFDKTRPRKPRKKIKPPDPRQLDLLEWIDRKLKEKNEKSVETFKNEKEATGKTP